MVIISKICLLTTRSAHARFWSNIWIVLYNCWFKQGELDVTNMHDNGSADRGSRFWASLNKHQHEASSNNYLVLHFPLPFDTYSKLYWLFPFNNCYHNVDRSFLSIQSLCIPSSMNKMSVIEPMRSRWTTIDAKHFLVQLLELHSSFLKSQFLTIASAVSVNICGNVLIHNHEWNHHKMKS